MEVEPKYSKLGAIFPENRIYNVPKFQRSYSWQKSNVCQFLSDIEEVYVSSCENEEAIDKVVQEGQKKSLMKLRKKQPRIRKID